jgi:hypothetical protein
MIKVSADERAKEYPLWSHCLQPFQPFGLIFAMPTPSNRIVPIFVPKAGFRAAYGRKQQERQ